MSQSLILRKTRRDHEKTLAQMAEWLGTSNQRVSQWESGEPIPAERVNAWIKDETLPDWVRQMARDLEVASLREAHQAIGLRIERLEQATPAA